MKAGQGEGADPRARLLRRLAQEVACVRPLSTADVALLVGRHPRELVQDSRRAAATRHLPPDLRLQAHLRHVVAVVSLAARHCESLFYALCWYRTAMLPGAGGRTPEDLTAEGNEAQACLSLVLQAANDDRVANFSA